MSRKTKAFGSPGLNEAPAEPPAEPPPPGPAPVMAPPHTPPPHAPPPHAPPPHAPPPYSAPMAQGAQSPWFHKVGLVYLWLALLPPLGIYGAWKHPGFDDDWRKKLTIGGAIWGVILLAALSSGGGSASSGAGGGGGDCAGTFEQNGCTYYRDSDCNVISRSCE